MWCCVVLCLLLRNLLIWNYLFLFGRRVIICVFFDVWDLWMVIFCVNYLEDLWLVVSLDWMVGVRRLLMVIRFRIFFFKYVLGGFVKWLEWEGFIIWWNLEFVVWDVVVVILCDEIVGWCVVCLYWWGWIIGECLLFGKCFCEENL